MLGDYTDVGELRARRRARPRRRHVATLRDFATRAEAVDPDGLDDAGAADPRGHRSPRRRTTADLHRHAADRAGGRPGAAGRRARCALVMGLLAVPDAAVADAMPAKLDGVGQYLRELAERTREGAADGLGLGRVRGHRDHRADRRGCSPTPLDDDPLVAAVQAARRGRRRRAARPSCAAAVERSVRPGPRGVPRRAARDALPDARSEERCGLSWLPGGDDAYAATLRYFTTTDKTAQEIHEIGLGPGRPSSPTSTARSAPRSSAPTTSRRSSRRCAPTRSSTSSTATSWSSSPKVALARAEAAMGDWFEVRAAGAVRRRGHRGRRQGVLLPAGHRRLPRRHVLRQHRRRRRRGDASSSRRWRSTRACPGHHLQLAIAAELPDSMPEFRKHLHNSAYAEGWGLYTERLSDEMGLYSAARRPDGDVQRRLACAPAGSSSTPASTPSAGAGSRRSTTWSANSPLTEGVCRPEVDRYICTPRPGDVVHDRPAGDPADAAPRPSSARATASTSRSSTPRCSTAARCRSTCSTGWSPPGCPDLPRLGGASRSARYRLETRWWRRLGLAVAPCLGRRWLEEG